MKRRTLVLVGLLVFAFTLLMHAPAVRLQAMFAPALASAGVGLQGVEGTLSAGHAAQIDVQGNPLLRDLDWTLRKTSLLLGRASFALAGGRDGTLVDGTASLAPSGALRLHDFKLASPLKEALAAAGYPFMPVEGQLGLDLDSARVRDGWPQQARGTLALRGLGWKLGREPVLLGDYEALIDDQAGGIKAVIRTLGGALEVSGEAQLGDDRSYQFHLQMRPRQDAPPMVQNLVRNLGQPDTQGWYHLRRQGRSPVAPTSPPGRAS